MGKKLFPAHSWIQVRSDLEAVHYIHALRAVNKALRHYACADPHGVMQQKEQILKGFENFVMLEKEFMDTL